MLKVRRDLLHLFDLFPVTFELQVFRINARVVKITVLQLIGFLVTGKFKQGILEWNKGFETIENVSEIQLITGIFCVRYGGFERESLSGAFFYVGKIAGQ